MNPTEPGLRADWIHKRLPLRIGKRKFQFRTFSLYDVWILWPHLAALAQSLDKGRPLTWARHLQAALKHLAPELLADEETFEKTWTPTHLDALIEFYREEHDWSRLQALGESATGTPLREADPIAPQEAQRNFYLVCMAAANAASMSVIEFVEQRFEFCADTIMQLHQTMKEQEKGLGPGQFAAVMGALLPTEKIGKGEKPAWIREIEEKTPRVQ